jgi:hypothetical protein
MPYTSHVQEALRTWEHALLLRDGVAPVARVHPQVLPAQLIRDEGWAALRTDGRVGCPNTRLLCYLHHEWRCAVAGLRKVAEASDCCLQGAREGRHNDNVHLDVVGTYVLLYSLSLGGRQKSAWGQHTTQRGLMGRQDLSLWSAWLPAPQVWR